MKSAPIPYYIGDRDYYSIKHPNRKAHIKAIEINNRIDARINASAGDGSYSVLITKKEKL
jgi:hypothetical protein